MTAATLEKPEDNPALKGLFIPPQPKVLLELKMLQRSPSPDLRRVANEIGRDPGLTAAMLKTVNSPAFGLRIGSITHAVTMLGLPRTFSIATGLALRAQMEGKVKLDRFWDTAADTAAACAMVARLAPGVVVDEAYMLGLFHECGVAILSMRFADYKDTLIEANRRLDCKFTSVEDERHGTNHAVVGHLVAKSWALPDDVREGILLHHEPMAPLLSDAGLSRNLRALLCTLKVGEYVSHSTRRMTVLHEWEENRDRYLDYLGLSHSDLDDLIADFECGDAHD